jgi:hypothetical protein
MKPIRASALLRVLCFFCCLTLPIYFAQAQSVQVGTQQDVASRAGNSTGQEGVGATVSDQDLGDISLVSRVPRPKMFTFYSSSDLYYTSNAFLADDAERNDFFWNPRVGASFVPYATRAFTPRITFEQNFFRYDRFSTLDFDSQTLLLDLKYSLRPDDSWFLDGSYSLSRLYSPHSGDDLYKDGLLFLSVTHTRALGESGVVFVGSLGASLRNGDPSAFDRATTYVNLQFIYSPIEHVQVSAFLRPDVQFYTNDPNDSSRTDLNLALGAGVNWAPIEYVSLGAGVSFVGNYSTESKSSYNVFSPSVTLGAHISF